MLTVDEEIIEWRVCNFTDRFDITRKWKEIIPFGRNY
jgi:hypothetical protein